MQTRLHRSEQTRHYLWTVFSRPFLEEGLWKFVLHFPPQGCEKGGNRFISELDYIVWTL